VKKIIQNLFLFSKFPKKFELVIQKFSFSGNWKILTIFQWKALIDLLSGALGLLQRIIVSFVDYIDDDYIGSYD
jgi:hypothetical protein